jgi:hypothetical protein
MGACVNLDGRRWNYRHTSHDQPAMGDEHRDAGA